jgi:hypothetical protein
MTTVNNISATTREFRAKQHENNKATSRMLEEQSVTLKRIDAVFQQILRQSLVGLKPERLDQVREEEIPIKVIPEMLDLETQHCDGTGLSLVSTNMAVLQQTESYVPTSDISSDNTFCRPDNSASWCNCSCHTRHYLCIPRFFEYITGRVCIQHVGLPYLAPPCNQLSCKKRSNATAHFTYHFPPWLLLRMISVTIEATNFQRCEISIRAPRVVPDKADLFRLASNGDKNGIQSLFDEGKASPYDIDCTNGVNALTVSYEGLASC